METKALKPGDVVAIRLGETETYELGTVSVLVGRAVILENGRQFGPSGNEIGTRKGWHLVEATDEIKAKVRRCYVVNRIKGVGMAKLDSLSLDRLEAILSEIEEG